MVAYVSVKSIGGLSLFNAAAVVTAANVTQFTWEEKDKHLAAGRL